LLLYKIVERQVKSWGHSDRIRIFGLQETQAAQNANCERSTFLEISNARTVSDLGKINAHHFRRFGGLPPGG
jgi:hypothetical protein